MTEGVTLASYWLVGLIVPILGRALFGVEGSVGGFGTFGAVSGFSGRTGFAGKVAFQTLSTLGQVEAGGADAGSTF